MQPLLQSAFLHSLGYAIANSLWQMALLWLVVQLINSIRLLTAAARYYVAIAAQFAGFIWFIATLQFYYINCSNTLIENTANGLVQSANTVSTPGVNSVAEVILYITVKAELLMPYLSFAYLSMLVFLSFRFIRVYCTTGNIRKNGLQKADAATRLFVQRNALLLNIKKEVKIYLSAVVNSPLTIGFLKPIILVPVASINHLTTAQLEALLLHELAHIKRADYLINLIETVVEMILFFNPFVQLLGKSIRNERENSCDDWVLQFQYKPAVYAEALLRIAYVQKGMAMAMHANGNKGDLLPRVKRMLNQQQEKKHHYRNQLLAFMLITILLCTVAWIQPSTIKNHTAPTQENTVAKTISITPLSAEANNPLFNPIYFLSDPIKKEIHTAVASASESILAAIPTALDATQQALTTITPKTAEVLQQISFDFANAFNNIDITTDATNTDPANADNEPVQKIKLGQLLQSEIANIDFKAIQKDLEAAATELNNLQKDKSSNSNKKEIETAIEDAFRQIIQVSGEKLRINEKIKAAAEQLKNSKQLQLNRQQIEEQRQKAIHEKDALEEDAPEEPAVLSDIEMPSLPHFNYNQPTYLSSVTAVNNNIRSVAYQTVNDSSNNLQSAVIIVKHNAANDTSHIKHINVLITGNNGVTKTYQLSVEVYQ
jgi:bla regulator protein blaR1